MYEDLILRPMRLDDWTAQVQGQIARAWYCGWLPPIGQELDRTRIDGSIIQSLRALDEAAAVLGKVAEQARRLALELEAKCSRLKSDRIMRVQERHEIQDIGRNMIELDKLIERLAAAQPSLGGFDRISKVLMHNLKGKQLADLGRESAQGYSQLLTGIGVLHDWIEFTLDLAKPVAVQNSTHAPIPFKKPEDHK